MRTPAEAVEAQLDAYNARDLDAFAESYAADVELSRLPSGQAFVRSQGELRARYGELFRGSPSLHCRLLARIVNGAFVIDHEEVEGLPGKGTVRAIAIYEVADGLIRRGWFPG